MFHQDNGAHSAAADRVTFTEPFALQQTGGRRSREQGWLRVHYLTPTTTTTLGPPHTPQTRALCRGWLSGLIPGRRRSYMHNAVCMSMHFEWRFVKRTEKDGSEELDVPHDTTISSLREGVARAGALVSGRHLPGEAPPRPPHPLLRLPP